MKSDIFPILHFILQLVGDKETAEDVRHLDSSGYLGENADFFLFWIMYPTRFSGALSKRE